MRRRLMPFVAIAVPYFLRVPAVVAVVSPRSTQAPWRMQSIKKKERKGNALALDARKIVKAKESRKVDIFISVAAGVVGFVDVNTVLRYGCYVNMMTGNCVRFACAVFEGKWTDASFYLKLIANYMLGNGLFRLLDLRGRWFYQLREGTKSQYKTNYALVVSPAVLTIFVAADIIIHYNKQNMRLSAPIMSLGFGLVNAASLKVTSGTVLFVITNHIGKIGISMCEYLAKKYNVIGKPCMDDDDDGLLLPWQQKDIQKSMRMVGGFLLGPIIFLALDNWWKTTGHKVTNIVPSLQTLPLYSTMVGIIYALLFVWFQYS